MGFTHKLGDDVSLELITPDATPDIFHLMTKNHERLREWAPWAQDEPTYETAREYVNGRVEAYFQGRSLPCIIYEGRSPIGFIELRIDQDRGIGDIGYWLDGDAEGNGIITRACESLITHGRSLGIKRFELRIATTNDRSTAVAERLGFELEGVLRKTTPVKDTRLDTKLYARLVD